MPKYLGKRYKLIRRTETGLVYQDAPTLYKRTPDIVRELYVHEYLAITLPGEQELVANCYRNGKSMGDKCVFTLVEIYRALSYPVKPYRLTTNGPVWADTGTPVPIPSRYYGNLINSEEYSEKPLLTPTDGLYKAHKSLLLSDRQTPGSLTPEERAFIARKTQPLHGNQRQIAEQTQLFDENKEPC